MLSARARKPMAQFVAVSPALPAVWLESTTVAAVRGMKTVVIWRRVAPGTVPMAASVCSTGVVSQTQPVAAAKRVKCVMRKQGSVFATKHVVMHARRGSSVMGTSYHQPAGYAFAIQVAQGAARLDKHVIRIITLRPAVSVAATPPAAAVAMLDSNVIAILNLRDVVFVHHLSAEAVRLDLSVTQLLAFVFATVPAAAVAQQEPRATLTQLRKPVVSVCATPPAAVNARRERYVIQVLIQTPVDYAL